MASLVFSRCSALSPDAAYRTTCGQFTAVVSIGSLRSRGLHPERGDPWHYCDSWDRNAPSLAVALNWGMGSSSLNAEVNAFDRLQIVRERNSS